MKEHQFKMDGQFDLIYGAYLALGSSTAARGNLYQGDSGQGCLTNCSEQAPS